LDIGSALRFLTRADGLVRLTLISCPGQEHKALSRQEKKKKKTFRFGPIEGADHTPAAASAGAIPTGVGRSSGRRSHGDAADRPKDGGAANLDGMNDAIGALLRRPCCQGGQGEQATVVKEERRWHLSCCGTESRLRVNVPVGRMPARQSRKRGPLSVNLREQLSNTERISTFDLPS
jgi:hypothetical protein